MILKDEDNENTLDRLMAWKCWTYNTIVINKISTMSIIWVRLHWYKIYLLANEEIEITNDE